MIALAAFVIFVIAAILGFAHITGVLFVVALACVGFALFALHGFAIGGGPYTWHR